MYHCLLLNYIKELPQQQLQQLQQQQQRRQQQQPLRVRMNIIDLILYKYYILSCTPKTYINLTHHLPLLL